MDEVLIALPGMDGAGTGGVVVLHEGMIVAGLGCRAGVGAGAVLAALDAALAAHALPRQALAAFATVPRKQAEPALCQAAEQLGLPLLVPDAQALACAATLTCSPASLAVTGLGSAAEASALAAIGRGACLLGPRTAVGAVTCALAFREGSAP